MNNNFYPIISVIPSYNPNSPTNRQMVEILHQIQNHTFTWKQALFSIISFMIPGPVSSKFALYNYLNTFKIDTSMLLAYSIAAISLIVFIIILSWIVPKIIRFFYYKNQKFVLLSVKPPYDTTQSTFSTSQLFTIIHSVGRQITRWDAFFGKKKLISCELVSTKEKGIRYIIRAPVENSEIIQKSLYAYLPGVEIKEIDDYLPGKFSDLHGKHMHVIDLKLYSHFLLPIQSQDTLSQHDPIAFLTAHMTKLPADNLIAMQVILTPVLTGTHNKQIKKMNRMEALIHHGFDITSQMNKDRRGFIDFILASIPFLIYLAIFLMFTPLSIFLSIITLGKWPLLPTYIFSKPKLKKNAELSKQQLDLQQMIKKKMNEELFEVSVRFCLLGSRGNDQYTHANGLISSLSVFQNQGFQDFDIKGRIPLLHRLPLLQKLTFLQFKYRLLSLTNTMTLSVSEVSSLYHFPYTATTKTEDMVKVYSKELPAPLSLKNDLDLDVIFGKNTYAGEKTDIGLTDKDRAKHVYLIGRTGSGKSTILFHMAEQDILAYRGICVIDPHGDLAEDLLTVVPDERKNEFVYINPYDLKYPVGINLIELQDGLDEDELELEKELVCENVIAIFRRVFSKEENTDAHRIEYILRNTIYTAFTVKDSTIFTVYNLLNDPKFQKEVVGQLEDENLINFWKNEYGIAGNYQVVKMVSGVTAKVGRFLFSPTAKRMLEQPKSTVNFDQVFEDGKILICNLAEGKLSEDTSELIGTVIISKIHQAALRRARIKQSDRKPFYLYVDEFQNFATKSFTKLLSGGRKFGLRVTIAQQSTAQHDDRNMVNVILANIANVICFQTASPIDEEMMWLQFAPTVEKGEIANLPQFRFYIKLSAITPEEPFSGETLPININHDQEKIDELIAASRKNYAIEYKKPIPKKDVKKNNKIKTGTKGENENSNVGSLL